MANFDYLASEDLEKAQGGVFNQSAQSAQVRRWNQPVIGEALFQFDMFRDWISGKGIITGSGSPGIGG